MAAKLLTVLPLLVLSGLFFAAGILEGGIMFLALAAVMLWAYLRRGADPQDEPREAEAEEGGGEG
jgi:hypothetical protein